MYNGVCNGKPCSKDGEGHLMVHVAIAWATVIFDSLADNAPCQVHIDPFNGAFYDFPIAPVAPLRRPSLRASWTNAFAFQSNDNVTFNLFPTSDGVNFFPLGFSRFQ